MKVGDRVRIIGKHLVNAYGGSSFGRVTSVEGYFINVKLFHRDYIICFHINNLKLVKSHKVKPKYPRIWSK